MAVFESDDLVERRAVILREQLKIIIKPVVDIIIAYATNHRARDHMMSIICFGWVFQMSMMTITIFNDISYAKICWDDEIVYTSERMLWHWICTEDYSSFISSSNLNAFAKIASYIRLLVRLQLMEDFGM